MRDELAADKAKGAMRPLLRSFGWGVPDEDSVLNSSRQAVTLVSQDEFIPFQGAERHQRLLRLHELPWPTEILEQLGDEPVGLRVTLSYFIEPNPSRRGWRGRYSYASHSLRFDLKRPTESSADFLRRLSRAAQDEEAGLSKSRSQAIPWFLGPELRNRGSLHQDEWTAPAIDLAACNSLAVYPVGGWWKYSKDPRRHSFPVRYSLLMSLRTTEQSVDLYTPIAIRLGVPVSTPIVID